jgi:hypothetical protein
MATRILALKRGEVQMKRKLPKRGTSDLVIFSTDDYYNKQTNNKQNHSVTH